VQDPWCKSCKLTAVSMSSSINARSLTKSMPDRDEDSPVANLKDDRQPPSSALPKPRQFRKQLVKHVTALSFDVGVGGSTYTERRFSK
jgi:hypothetical protein